MKKNHKSLLFYLFTLIIFLSFMYLVHTLAQTNLEHTDTIVINANEASSLEIFINNFKEGIKSAISTLLIQLAIILFAVKLFGAICKKIGQPAVVGEIIAGIILGPSLLGLLFPEWSALLFPESSLKYIDILSQVGLILFMFIVGLELNLNEIKRKANDAIIISHASIIFPFTLGFVLAYFMYDSFANHTMPFISFALFMGIAMSITAFPVLARIVYERGINKTPLGSIAITCAAIDDITAWCLLATVITIVKANSFTGSIYVIIICIFYVIVMFKIVKPILKKLTEKLSSKKMLNRSMLILYFIILFLSAYTTEIIGIHALFGAFLAGVIMPTGLNFREKLTVKIEDITLIIFLPLFFVYTGLKTQIGLLNDWSSWLTCITIVTIAIVGKYVGSALASRFIGLNWKDSSIIGILMNTRGLMELVVLNIGHDLGVLSPKVFAMMVVMALVTTLMTSPLLNMIDKLFKRSEQSKSENKTLNILIPFDDVSNGQKLLFLAKSLSKKNSNSTKVAMLYVTEGNHLYQHSEEDEEVIFRPIINEAKSIQQEILTIFKVSNNLGGTAVKYANSGEFSLILINDKNSNYKETVFDKLIKGFDKAIHLPDRILGKLGNNKDIFRSIVAPFDETTRAIISKSDMSVGVLIDNNFILDIRKIFIPILDEDDVFIGPYIERIAMNLSAQILLWDNIKLANQSIEFTKHVRKIKEHNPYHYQQWNNNILIDLDIIKKQDLIIVSVNSWLKLLKKIDGLESNSPSVLVLTY